MTDQALDTHAWPGNIRELQNVFERAVILCGEDGMINFEQLGLNGPVTAAPAASGSTPMTSSSAALGSNSGSANTLADIEKQHILAVLRECEFNRTQAAKALDINIRTLRNKLNEYKAAGETVEN